MTNSRCVLLIVLLWRASFVDAADPAGNFTCSDPEFVAAAEQARLDSATLWSGAPLPGRWSCPCPIQWRSAGHAGGGATRFDFDRGEVSGWAMDIEGRRPELLDDVIPHEVDHMVRASLVRRPIPRWLDEGCASLMESADSHEFLRTQLAQHVAQPLTAEFLDGLDYPIDPRAQARLYAVGFSLVEFLLTRGDAQELLQFQTDERAPSDKLMDHYGLTVADFDREWRSWTESRCAQGVDCHSVNCLRHIVAPLTSGPGPRAATAVRPKLTIYSSEWCGPCRQFWSDFRSDAEFRSTLERAFMVETLDVDRQPLVARLHHIDSVPTFVTPRQRVHGYEGAKWLLQQLDLETHALPDAVTPAPTADAIERLAVQPLATSAPAPSPPMVALPASPAVEAPPAIPSATPGVLQRGAENAVGAAVRAWPWLEIIGLAGGSAATGGIGAILVAAAIGLVRRRRARRASRQASPPEPPPAPAGGGAIARAPFPRRLDEACELLELRQSEGRVAVLDALRGMFFEDELQKSLATASPAEAAALTRLRTTLDARLQEVAPLSTSIDF